MEYMPDPIRSKNRAYNITACTAGSTKNIASKVDNHGRKDEYN